MRLSRINIYPIKSTTGHAPEQAAVEPRGLRDDRRWLVVDPAGTGLTGRNHAALLGIQTTLDGDAMVLSAPGAAPIRVPRTPPAGETVAVTIWRDAVDATAVGAQADAWLTEVLGAPVRLVHMPPGARREVDPERSRPGDTVSFADAFPLLLIGEGSLEDLNMRLDEPVGMARFRPNLTVSGTEAFAEDGWRHIRIGEVEFEVAGPCDRCVMTTIDPETRIADAGREPLRTLAGYRRDPARGILFGVNLIPRGEGVLRRGDAIEVLETRPE